MAVIGTGQAHGACSLLHAAGTGYGASLSLDLPVIVKALDRPSKRELNDNDNLLATVVDTWVENQLPLPNDLQKEDIYWAVASKIPQSRGLKSSAAIKTTQSSGFNPGPSITTPSLISSEFASISFQPLVMTRLENYQGLMHR